MRQVAEIAERLGIPHPHKIYRSDKKGKVFYF